MRTKTLVTVAALCLAGLAGTSQAAARTPQPSIAYSVWEDDHYTLWLMNADGSHQQRLYAGPPGSFALDASWSPDRRWIAFSGQLRSHDVAVENHQILLIRPDGSGLHQVTFVAGYKRAPSWSPDGKRLVYMDDRDLGSPDPVWSDQSELRVLDLSRGTDTELLTPGPELSTLAGSGWLIPSWPRWSPKGDEILFSLEAGVWGGPEVDQSGGPVAAVHSDGTGLHLIAQSGVAQVPRWSPDATHLSYIGTDQQVHVIAADGTGDRVITHLSCVPYFLDWSPDGKSLAVQTQCDPNGHAHLVRITVADGAQRQLTSSATDEVIPAWRG